MAEHKYDAGGGDTDDNGTLCVALDRFYGETVVNLALWHGATFAALTADQARAVAADLIKHADQVDALNGVAAPGYPGGRSNGEVADVGTTDVAREIPPSTVRPPTDTTDDSGS